MASKLSKAEARKKRHVRVRKKVEGNAERPRLAVYRSNDHIYAQVIDDIDSVTLASASTSESDVRKEFPAGGSIESAQKVGELVAVRATEKGIKSVVFDRGRFQFHGQVKALADGARDKGLTF